jgi:hypothetical protein
MATLSFIYFKDQFSIDFFLTGFSHRDEELVQFDADRVGLLRQHLLGLRHQRGHGEPPGLRDQIKGHLVSLLPLSCAHHRNDGIHFHDGGHCIGEVHYKQYCVAFYV